jgi:hypothetical protein
LNAATPLYFNDYKSLLSNLYEDLLTVYREIATVSGYTIDDNLQTNSSITFKVYGSFDSTMGNYALKIKQGSYLQLYLGLSESYNTQIQDGYYTIASIFEVGSNDIVFYSGAPYERSISTTFTLWNRRSQYGFIDVMQISNNSKWINNDTLPQYLDREYVAASYKA